METENETQSKRLKILKDDEIKLIYDRPEFSLQDREEYFDLSNPEETLLNKHHSINSKVNFILQLGYFKFKYRFFSFKLNEIQDDIKFIIEKYFKNKSIINIEEINKKTRLENQNLILKLFKYKYFDKHAKQKIEEKSFNSVKISAKPIYIYRDIFRFLENQRIITPSYSFMQELIGKVINSEQSRLIDITEKNIEKQFFNELDNLILCKNDSYEITSIKKSPKDFRYGEIRKEISRGNKIRKLYLTIDKIIPILLISNESIKYYASLVDFYSVYRLSRLDIKIVRVYLICFLYHRFNKFNDNLINAMNRYIRAFDEESNAFSNEKILEYRIEGNSNVIKAGKILKIFLDKKIPDNEHFISTKNRAFKLLDEKKLAFIADYIENNASFDETEFKWQYIDNISQRFKKNIRPIIMNVEFRASYKKPYLLDALINLKKNISKTKGIKCDLIEFVDKFIPKNSLKYIYKDKKIIPDRYEYLIYRLLRNNLESGDIFCSDSVRFRSFESELITEDEWKNKKNLIFELGLKTLEKPIQKHLLDLELILESKILSINQKIEQGENKHFEMNKTVRKSRWHINTPASPDSINHHLFDSLKQIDISDVIYFTETNINFMESFDHILGRFVKNEIDNKSITACLIAWATNMGLTKMGDISDISYNKLSSTSDNYIRLETVQDANDRIANIIHKLPIFCKYHINDVIHASSDGQKYETKIPTINSRPSKKYFGLKSGVVSYTLVANNIPINSKIIGANEHESHYVFDILFNNKNDIKPEVHSTDTHGTNEVNFAILYTFGYQFAPRYKDFYDTFTDSFRGFKNVTEYGDLILKPKRKIDTQLIIDEWDTIQKIMVSLGVKKTTQNIIVGKLSSYARKNKTRRALWEYNSIIKSIYLLDYIDSTELRQNVQRALNRGESYHQLKRAVSYANFGKLRFKTEDEQQIWDACARLITNSIVFYNLSIFLNLMACGKLSEESIKLISPVAWQHINFFGRYEFKKKSDPLDLDAITKSIRG